MHFMCSSDDNSLANSANDIKNLLVKHSVSFVKPSGRNKVNNKVYVKLPDDVEVVRIKGNNAFNS